MEATSNSDVIPDHIEKKSKKEKHSRKSSSRELVANKSEGVSSSSFIIPTERSNELEKDLTKAKDSKKTVEGIPKLNLPAEHQLVKSRKDRTSLGSILSPRVSERLQSESSHSKTKSKTLRGDTTARKRSDSITKPKEKKEKDKDEPHEHKKKKEKEESNGKDEKKEREGDKHRKKKDKDKDEDKRDKKEKKEKKKDKDNDLSREEESKAEKKKKSKDDNSEQTKTEEVERRPASRKALWWVDPAEVEKEVIQKKKELIERRKQELERLRTKLRLIEHTVTTPRSVKFEEEVGAVHSSLVVVFGT
jgi:hypothetical protein